MQHEAGEIVVAKIEGAFGEVGQLFGKSSCTGQRIPGPEHDRQGAGHAGDALTLHGVANLIDTLRGLQVHIHPVQRVEKVGGIVVPAQMQDGTGISHDFEMVLK